MSIQEELRRGFIQFRKAVGISDSAQILFLYKTPTGYEEKGVITDYFYIKQEKGSDGKNIAWLKVLNTSENRTLFDAANLIVAQNLNPLLDDQIFTLNKQFDIPTSLLTIHRQINPTGNKYTPAP